MNENTTARNTPVKDSDSVKYIGSHVSMKAPKYFSGSIEEALSYGSTACMIYTGPPQNTKRTPVENLRIAQGTALYTEQGWEPFQVVVHAPYLINLANSVEPQKAMFSREFLKEELRRVQAFNARYLVLHPGAHMRAGTETGIRWIVDGLNEVLEEDQGSVMILLETMTGKGSEIGSTFEELQAILEGVKQKERVGICMDTCHLHDSGRDLKKFDEILEEFDELIGLDKLKVVHVNDSQNERGVRKDRHANIGKGRIGLDTLGSIVHHPRLDSVIKILETPWIENLPPYKEEIEMLRSWKPEKTKEE